MAGQKRKAKKGRRNHNKDTGMFAFTFLTISSLPATHRETGPEKHCYLNTKAKNSGQPKISY